MIFQPLCLPSRDFQCVAGGECAKQFFVELQIEPLPFAARCSEKIFSGHLELIVQPCSKI
jgi:hypothetical protein